MIEFTMDTLLFMVPIASVLALAVAFIFYKQIFSLDKGTPEMQAISDNDYLACFQCAAERNILIEIHYTACSNHWKHCENGFPVEYIRMATLAKEAGCKFTFGSDSHSPNKFGNGIHEGMERFAKYCGISESSIVHELPCNNKNFPR